MNSWLCRSRAAAGATSDSPPAAARQPAAARHDRGRKSERAGREPRPERLPAERQLRPAQLHTSHARGETYGECARCTNAKDEDMKKDAL